MLKTLTVFNKTGFTLTEILVVVSVISVLGAVLTQIFTVSLRGDSKAQLLGVIKQNGTQALNSIKTTIRTADQVVCTTDQSVSTPTIVVVGSGVYTRYRICPEGSPSSLCSLGDGNGKILVDNPLLTPDQTSTPSQLTDLCANGLQTNPTTITDDNTSTGVSVANGGFQWGQSPGYKDSVTVTFSLKPGVAAQKTVSNQIDPVNFTTTVDLR